MPSIESPPAAERYQVPDTRTDSPRAVAHPTRRLRRRLSDFLAGLNQLLKLSDFGGGDYFRD